MARIAQLSRERVLTAAVALIDREGLEAVSMRRLGETLGVEAMSLYRYVEGKAALLDGVVETIANELPAIDAKGRSWDAVLRERARSLRAALRAHPKALPLFATRPAVTPASLAHVESALVVLREAGFSVTDALRAFQSLLVFVVGHALGTLTVLASDERSAPAYAALDAKAFPRVLEVAALMARYDVDAEFEHGLEAMLRGIASLQAEAIASKPKRKSAR